MFNQSRIHMFPIKFPGCPNTDPEAISSLPSFWIIQVKRLGPECANDVPVYVLIGLFR
jgi:hypothetical protein